MKTFEYTYKEEKIDKSFGGNISKVTNEQNNVVYFQLEDKKEKLGFMTMDDLYEHIFDTKKR